MPVGVRGLTRRERFAAFVSVAEIANRLSPEDLTVADYVIEQRRKDAIPALAALDHVCPSAGAPRLPAGSRAAVSALRSRPGWPAATASSDLDLILRQERRLEPNQAGGLLAALAQTAAPARIDVLLETPSGGVSLADLATTRSQVLVRTPYGPRLSVDPSMSN